MKPIAPSEIGKSYAESVPDDVFAAFDELIAANWTGTRSVVKQSAVVALIKSKMELRDRLIVPVAVDMRWLNIEDAYRAAGWKVTYDNPAYNESYPATFEFTRGDPT